MDNLKMSDDVEEKLKAAVQEAAKKTKFKGVIFMSKAPDDLGDRKQWAHHIMRIQVAMWVDGKSKCEVCGHIYTSVDDFLERNPRCGRTKDLSFIDSNCWENYDKKHKHQRLGSAKGR